MTAGAVLTTAGLILGVDKNRDEILPAVMLGNGKPRGGKKDNSSQGDMYYFSDHNGS